MSVYIVVTLDIRISDYRMLIGCPFCKLEVCYV